ncbi:steryl acetyl hydrolase, partial [Staphylococcus aureus]
LVSEVGHQNIVVMGDGSGGALALSFVQSLLDAHKPLPNKVYLISPILDATLSNKDISETLIEQDAVLSQFGVNEIMKKWANGI